jgi:hypothetical protein
MPPSLHACSKKGVPGSRFSVQGSRLNPRWRINAFSCIIECTEWRMRDCSEKNRQRSDMTGMLTQNKLTMGISFGVEGITTDQVVFSVS